MTGTLALIGGGEFSGQVEELDRRLLAAAGTDRVLVMPTADAFEHPQRAVDRAVDWYGSIGAKAEGLMVLRRTDAQAEELAAAVRAARFVYLQGDSPMHMRSVLKETPVWSALVDLLASGGVVAGSGPSAAALCDPMVDPRGGAFTLGLGLVRGLALVTEADQWSADTLKRTLRLASGFPVAVLAPGSALVRTVDGWDTYGDAEVHGGELPPPPNA
jgi:cyanophycinase